MADEVKDTSTPSENQTISTQAERTLDRLYVEANGYFGIKSTVTLDDGTNIAIRSRSYSKDGMRTLAPDIPENVKLEFIVNGNGATEDQSGKYYYGKFSAENEKKLEIRKVTTSEDSIGSILEEATPEATIVITSALENIAFANREARRKIELERQLEYKKRGQPLESPEPERRVKIAVDTHGRHHEVYPGDPLYHKK